MTTYSFPSSATRPRYRDTIKLGPESKMPTLEDLCKRQKILPAYSLILGLDTDQIPVILDLTGPFSGSFLIAGDSGFSNTRILHSILSSGFMLNTESEVNIHLISPQADHLTQFHRQPNFKVCYHPHRKECEIVLEEMTSLIESRNQRLNPNPIHVLFIDSADILWSSLSPQGRIWLNWIATYGPQHGLKVFATLETDYFSPKLEQLIECFPSRILGHINSGDHAEQLSVGFSPFSITELTPENEFIALTEDSSIRLQLIESGFAN